jgi:hypothetical protein
MSSTDITRPPVQDVKPFWPVGRRSLTVSIEPSSGQMIARGYDPNQATGVLVFTATLRPDQEAAFLEAVRVGTPGVEVASNDNQMPNSGGAANTVVVSDPGPGDGKGPKFWEVPLQVAGLATRTRPTGT